MNEVFADTFYWIAFTNVQDSAHQRAKTFSTSANLGLICTTKEVLTEYLNYFAAWGSRFRQKAAVNVQIIQSNQAVRVLSQTADSFRADLNFIAAASTKNTA